MSIIIGAIAIQSITLINPISVAVTILAISIVAAAIIFKASLSRWLAIILILTFSSGIMTLFIYTAAISANEKNNKKTKKTIIIIVVIVIPLIIKERKTDIKERIKTFSNKKILILITIVLILTILAISRNGHNPNQTLNTSF